MSPPWTEEGVIILQLVAEIDDSQWAARSDRAFCGPLQPRQLYIMTENMLHFSAKIPSNKYLRICTTTFDFYTFVERVKPAARVRLTYVGNWAKRMRKFGSVS
jgi:hypothetical protein